LKLIRGAFLDARKAKQPRIYKGKGPSTRAFREAPMDGPLKKAQSLDGPLNRPFDGRPYKHLAMASCNGPLIRRDGSSNGPCRQPRWANVGGASLEAERGGRLLERARLERAVYMGSSERPYPTGCGGTSPLRDRFNGPYQTRPPGTLETLKAVSETFPEGPRTAGPAPLRGRSETVSRPSREASREPSSEQARCRRDRPSERPS
jgi:hypothetical protein